MPGPPGLTKFARKTLFRFSGTKLNRLLIWHLYEGKPQGLNWIFPVLMEEELPGCSQHFVPGNAIAQMSATLNEEFLATTGPDRRKLWALSTSVGHASPSTTVGSYLHCLDWLLSYALQQRSPKLTDPVLSALTGLTQNNIRVLRSKKKIAPDNYVYWVGHNRPEWCNSVRPVLKSPSATLAPLQQPMLKHMLKLPLPGTDMIAILHAVVHDRTDVGALARRHGLLPEEFKPWIKYAKALDQLVGQSPSSRGSHSFTPPEQDFVSGFGIRIDRRVPVFSPLRQNDERQRLNRWTAALHHFMQDRPSEAIEWLNQFWNCRRSRAHEIAFRNLSKARLFIEQLQIVAPEKPLPLAYHLYPLESKKAPSSASQAKSWADALGIPIEMISVKSGIARQYDGDQVGTLALALTHEHRLGRETIKARENGAIPQRVWQKTTSLAMEGACYAVTIWLLAGLYKGATQTASATPSKSMDIPSGRSQHRSEIGHPYDDHKARVPCHITCWFTDCLKLETATL